MDNRENIIEFKALQTLIENEIDVKLLIEYFALGRREQLTFEKQFDGTGVILSAMTKAGFNEFTRFHDILKKMEEKFPDEVKRYSNAGINPAEKLELMLQNAEKLIRLLEIRKEL